MRCIIVAAFAVGLAGNVSAQERPRPAVEATGGWVGFLDDSIVSDPLVGGGLRWYVSPRLSVGPEVTYMIGRVSDNLMITGNVVFDLVSPRAATPWPAVPYVVGGAGINQYSQSFGPFTRRSNGWAFTGGGGVRIRVNDRIYVAPEFRFGFELHMRATGTLGVRF